MLLYLMPQQAFQPVKQSLWTPRIRTGRMKRRHAADLCGENFALWTCTQDFYRCHYFQSAQPFCRVSACFILSYVFKKTGKLHAANFLGLMSINYMLATHFSYKMHSSTFTCSFFQSKDFKVKVQVSIFVGRHVYIVHVAVNIWFLPAFNYTDFYFAWLLFYCILMRCYREW